MSFVNRLLRRNKTVAFESVSITPRSTTIYAAGSEWPDFAAALEAYKNPVIALAVDSIVGGIMSTGFYFTSKDPEAARKVTQWADKIGLRGILFDVLRELVLTGNSFLKPEGTGENLQLIRIPLLFFRPQLDVVIENYKVRVVNYYISFQVGMHYETRKLPADEVIHLAWNIIDPSRPWGCGIAYQLVTRQRDWNGNEVPSILEAEATLRRNLILFLIRAIPKRLVQVKNVSSDKLEQIVTQLSNILQDPAQDHITNVEIDVKELKSQELKFDYYTIFENLLISGVRTPTVKLFTTPGFTEASAREATSQFEIYINSIREYVEHVLEYKIFPLVVGPTAHVEIHWGQPQKPELKFADIIQAARADAHNAALISREEARTMLRELGWILQETPAEVGEALFLGRKGRIIDTLAAVHIYLVDVDDIDKPSLRYYTVDSERGIKVATAWVKSLRQRQIVMLIFDKTLYDWTPETARQYYATTFPQVLEKLGPQLI